MIPALVVVGSLNMDFVVSVERLPVPGETVLGRDFQMIPGGKGANQACAAGKLGAGAVAVRMIGRVGYDVFADHLKASLAAAGVDVSAVHASKSQPTGVALIWVDRQGQNSIVVASGANYALAAADVEAMRKVFHGAGLALFQLETPLDTVAAALRPGARGRPAHDARSCARAALARRTARARGHPDAQRNRSADAAGPSACARHAGEAPELAAALRKLGTAQRGA
jgi:sugar/nucleoside kinase (ribokinase family)